MASLTNKRILLGVTGGIAAYKSADLVRRLRDAGAEVRVVMTQGATEFITPLTLQAVSGQPVRQHLLDAEAESGMGHIELARWADAVLVAPASADFLARLAQGRADDLLTTLSLAHDGVVAVAPAMNNKMWENPATRDNLALLAARAVRVFGPASGSQACGEVGAGRMLEPNELVTLTAGLFATGALDGVKVVITAGPTWEALDPVRGLSNRSSGKMGYAVAQAAIEAGAAVTLISGPTHLPAPERATLIRVESAEDMFRAVHAQIADAGIFIGVAAVADYRPKQVAATKIKKSAEALTMELVRNPDILASVAALDPRPFTVGFAAETGDLIKNAQAKLVGKRVDLIAVNPVGGADSGFDADTNTLTLVEAGGITELPLLSKSRLARRLIDHIAQRIHAQDPAQSPRPAHRQ